MCLVPRQPGAGAAQESPRHLSSEAHLSEKPRGSVLDKVGSEQIEGREHEVVQGV